MKSLRPRRLSAIAAATLQPYIGPAESVEPKMSREEFEASVSLKLIEEAAEKWVTQCAQVLTTLGVSELRAQDVAMKAFDNATMLGTVRREFAHWPSPASTATAHMLANSDEADISPFNPEQ